MSFSDLGLRAELLRAVREQNYTTPTPIQAQAIPLILQGRDVLGTAQTGTGKTAGFALPILHRLAQYSSPQVGDHIRAETDASRAPEERAAQECLSAFRAAQRRGRPGQREDRPSGGHQLVGSCTQREGSRAVRVLVLVPTRELAAQVHESFRTYGAHLSLRSTVVFGGVSMQPQIAALRKRPDILVATPGRLLDHVGRRHVDLSHVEMLVLDEADRMLDMGFIHDIRRVLALLPQKRQNLMFSATFDAATEELAGRFLQRPERISVSPRNTAVDTVNQLAYAVDRTRKADLLAELIKRGDWAQVLVFARTKHRANHVAEKLERSGITATAIHGNKSQSARTRALSDFKSGHVRVLVATEVAARGLDIDGLPYVVNFELPFVAQDYVHRIGRTGRAGATGTAVSLVCVDEFGLLRDIERLLRRELKGEVVPGFEPDPSMRPEAIQQGRGGGNRGLRNSGARSAPWRYEGGRRTGRELQYAGQLG